MKIAAVQFEITGNKKYPDFIAQFESHIIEAKKNNAELVLFPELITVDLMPHVEGQETEILKSIADSVTPKFFSRVQELAKKHEVAILGGTSPRFLNNKIVNTAILAFADGKTIYQDKIFPTPDEVIWGWQGGSTLKVFNAPWGKTAILICYDCEFPKLSDIIAKEKPEVILVPSMTGSEQGFHRVRWTAQARAIEHFAYVVHTGTVMTRKDAPPGHWLHYGQASFLGPQEAALTKITVEGEKLKPSIIYDTLDFSALRAGREKAGIYPAREQEKRQTPIFVGHE
ncbi:MAG: hypothetical protein A4S09_03255 [Proteobacteria bacterium SG_bin7]|nr:MAG: hypothetical protein A4S09_03255 [Proteobacteria bacterium SG_bin7]